MMNCLKVMPIVCVILAVAFIIVFKLLRVRHNAVRILTCGVYVALWGLFFLDNLNEATLMNGHVGLDYGIQALVDAAKVFTLNVDFEVAKAFVTNMEWFPQVWFTHFAALLFLVAPVLTVGNILSLFRGVMDKMRFLVNRVFRTRYVFSELNEKSLAMASSIGANPIIDNIVFANCGALSEENANEKELLEQAYDLNAICLKRDLSHINLGYVLGKNKIFIISENESENVSQTLAAIKKYKNRRISNAIYAYIVSEEEIEIIDSADKGTKLLNKRFVKEIEKNPKGIFEPSTWKERDLNIEGNFSVRCINSAEQTVRKMVKDSYRTVHEKATKDGKVVSVAILGLGRYGMQFLKTASWMYQMMGYRVEFNVFDKDETAKNRLERECPELLSKGNISVSGESSHDISVYNGIDCLGSDFDKKLSGELKERLARTQMVFVALGDDDKNVEMAMHIRRLFLPEKEPMIFAVVRDTQKNHNLSACDSDVSKGLRNYKGDTYDIHFVGEHTQEYSFAHIKECQEIEKIAFQHHINWIRKNADENKTLAEDICREAESYARYSYYRNSSAAMEIHRKLLREYTKDMTDEEKCITEHMRWNAYMRGLGYQYSASRKDIAKLHNCLVPFEQLSQKDKNKDIVDFDLLFNEVK